MVTNHHHYIAAVLAFYQQLPDTPSRHSRYDRHLAAQLCQQKVPLPVVESAFLLATTRRLFRDPSYPPLSPIRSLHYFLPLIAELLDHPLSPTYIQYLRLKLASLHPPVNLPPLNLP